MRVSTSVIGYHHACKQHQAKEMQANQRDSNKHISAVFHCFGGSWLTNPDFMLHVMHDSVIVWSVNARNMDKTSILVDFATLLAHAFADATSGHGSGGYTP